MLAEKWGNSEFTVLNKIFLDFFDKSTGKEIATVELDVNGNSKFTNLTSGEDQALVEDMNGDGFSFKFKKIGRLMKIITDFINIRS